MNIKAVHDDIAYAMYHGSTTFGNEDLHVACINDLEIHDHELIFEINDYT